MSMPWPWAQLRRGTSTLQRRQQKCDALEFALHVAKRDKSHFFSENIEKVEKTKPRSKYLTSLILCHELLCLQDVVAQFYISFKEEQPGHTLIHFQFILLLQNSLWLASSSTVVVLCYIRLHQPKAEDLHWGRGHREWSRFNVSKTVSDDLRGGMFSTYIYLNNLNGHRLTAMILVAYKKLNPKNKIIN